MGGIGYELMAFVSTVLGYSPSLFMWSLTFLAGIGLALRRSPRAGALMGGAGLLMVLVLVGDILLSTAVSMSYGLLPYELMDLFYLVKAGLISVVRVLCYVAMAGALVLDRMPSALDELEAQMREEGLDV